MAAANNNAQGQDQEELQLSRQRLWIPSHYCNERLFAEFFSPVGGLGIQAITDIPSGTPIISEQELFFVNNKARLPAAQMQVPEFLALSQPHPNSTARQRFDANNFSMGGSRRGTFVQAARFNHSCVPNAHFTWNTIIQRLTVHAIIDIPAGTEIFLNYRVDDYTETTQRRIHALGYYNFTCDCSACQTNTPFSTASADRRGQMRNLKAELNRNKNSTQPNLRNERLGKIKAFGALLRQEGLFYPQLADMLLEEARWYRREMRVAAAAPQVEGVRYKVALRLEALRVARSKLDMDVLCNGYVSDEVEKTLRLIEELKAL